MGPQILFWTLNCCVKAETELLYHSPPSHSQTPNLKPPGYKWMLSNSSNNGYQEKDNLLNGAIEIFDMGYTSWKHSTCVVRNLIGLMCRKYLRIHRDGGHGHDEDDGEADEENVELAIFMWGKPHKHYDNNEERGNEWEGRYQHHRYAAATTATMTETL